MPFLRPLLFFLFSGMATVSALALDAPDKSPILTVTGEIGVTNIGVGAAFDRAMLEALDWREIETYTPFTEGIQRFSGPTLASLLDALEVDDGLLLAVALNDYTIDIPVKDARAHGILLALDHNGSAMRLRDKGPIWLIYPWGEPEGFDPEQVSRMIWQLNRLRVQR